jgi:putative nucleotidyltransferase with HDIG domain
MQARSWRDDLRNTAASIQILPVFAGVIMESVRLVNDRTSSFASIADVIRHDQSISAKLISIANSAFYSRGVPITRLQRAMIAVGLEQTKHIITCIILIHGIFKELRLQRDVSRGLTRHALLLSYTAQRLAEKTLKVHPDKAFIAGLIHDIGKVIFCLRDRSYLSWADQVAEAGGDLCGFEREIYGIDHEEIGHCLSIKWRFPEELVEVVSHHHGFGGQTDPLVKVVGIAHSVWTYAKGDLPPEAIMLLPERQRIE